MSDRTTRPRLLYGITAPSAVDVLLRGQLADMVSRGWEVHLVANDGAQTRSAITREGVTAFHPVHMTRSITPWADLKSLWRWIRVLREVKPAAVNVSSPKAGLLGSIASFLCRVPTRVYVLRGARFETTTGTVRVALVALERLATRCATDVVAISASLRDVYETERIVAPARMRVIGAGSSNGIPAEALNSRFAQKDRKALRKAYLGDSSQRKCVLFLGRVTQDKGIVDLARAMHLKGLEDAVLLVVGETEQDLRDPSIELLRAQGRLVEKEHLKDITEAFAVADVLCLPSHREGLGNVLLEASAVGLPVVGTKVTGVVDAVMDGRTGLLAEPRTPVSLAACLSTILREPALASRLGASGSRWVKDAFAAEPLWTALDAIYRSHLPSEEGSY